MKTIIIMISGRGSNMLTIAKETTFGKLKEICEIQAVFSNREDAVGLQKASELGILTHVIASKGYKRIYYNSLLIDWLRSQNPGYIILAGYMKILSPKVIREFPGRIINIHPADTAEHQGLHGYEWAWENKLETTKVTVHFVDEGLDTGEIIGQKTVDLTEVNSLEEVESRGLKVEHEFYSECLRKVLTGEDGKTQKD
ncbi:MAG: phosphoribosylglycinamide formyltransferase [Candidatus Tenebribacter burtonii]|nr:phosphoribosylglycinamide formyltransferase [Candidatus Tenebribacter burtonii]